MTTKYLSDKVIQNLMHHSILINTMHLVDIPKRLTSVML